MTLKLYEVRERGSSAVTVVAARARLTARMRAGELRGVPYSRLVASEVEDEPRTRSRFRCGRVRVDLLWSARGEEWHAEVTAQGERRHVTVGAPAWDGGRREAARVAARGAVQFLLDADDLDEALTLWAGAPGKEELHVVED